MSPMAIFNRYKIMGNFSKSITNQLIRFLKYKMKGLNDKYELFITECSSTLYVELIEMTL